MENNDEQLTVDEIHYRFLDTTVHAQNKQGAAILELAEGFRDAYHALRDVCRAMGTSEGKTAEEWREVAAVHQKATQHVNVWKNQYFEDWQKAMVQVQSLQAQVAELSTGKEDAPRRHEEKQLTMDNGQLTTKDENSPRRHEGHEGHEGEDVVEALARVIHKAAQNHHSFLGDYDRISEPMVTIRIAQAHAALAFRLAMVPESARVDEEKRGRLVAEERVLALEAQLRAERAEADDRLLRLKDEHVKAREDLRSNHANELAGVHAILAEKEGEQLTMDNGQLTTKEENSPRRHEGHEEKSDCNRTRDGLGVTV